MSPKSNDQSKETSKKPLNESDFEEAAEPGFTEIEETEKIYWSVPEELHIANWKPEKWSGGRLVSPERPLKFANHIRVARTHEEITFIEKSNSFAANTCVLATSMEDARNMTARHNQMKQIKVHQTEDVTSRIIQEKA